MYRSEIADAYERRLIDDGVRIESVCLKCRHTIISSVREGLERQELEHAKNCFLVKPAAASEASGR